MREFIFYLTLWETDSDYYFVWDVDDSSDISIDLLAFLMELILRLFQLLLASTDEQ